MKHCLSAGVKKTQLHRFWGETIILPCHNPRGLEHIVKWMKGDDVIENATKPSLRLDTTKASHAGIYICKNGPYTSRITLKLALPYPLPIDFLKRPQDISVVPNSTTEITYKVKTNPGYTLHGSWLYKKQKIPKDQIKESFELQTGVLTSTLTIMAEESKGEAEVFEFTVIVKRNNTVVVKRNNTQVGERKDSSRVTVTTDI